MKRETYKKMSIDGEKTFSKILFLNTIHQIANLKISIHRVRTAQLFTFKWTHKCTHNVCYITMFSQVEHTSKWDRKKKALTVALILVRSAHKFNILTRVWVLGTPKAGCLCLKAKKHKKERNFLQNLAKKGFFSLHQNAGQRIFLLLFTIIFIYK